jgi:hypothetical protein
MDLVVNLLHLHSVKVSSPKKQHHILSGNAQRKPLRKNYATSTERKVIMNLMYKTHLFITKNATRLQ